jgi:hypothetical protein
MTPEARSALRMEYAGRTAVPLRLDALAAALPGDLASNAVGALHAQRGVRRRRARTSGSVVIGRPAPT